ncbi:hypothetical protein PFFCH_00519 [Plasmodium falciparum FCH/4]|uniref:Duffy-binding-like domain-containing protein n=1 Tax=Plasmodium falciparum FCH/4 TaxID=1036724 RepID=A0A024VUA3_PLAFA|nr:hypothetical protein PFFCH_00519 [Plasmodium falciparum FCH/4]
MFSFIVFNRIGGGASGGGASGDKNGGSDSQDLYQKWTCYQFEDLQKDGQDVVEDEDDLEYDELVKAAGGLCILPNPKKNKEEIQSNPQKEPEQFQKTYNDFFNFWVAHMLKDSIYWRTKRLRKCINNTNESKACKNNDKCKTDCDCFEKWIEQKKKEEWEKIKEQFSKQENIPRGWTHYDLLENVLKLEFSNEDSEEKSQTGDEDANEKKRIKEMFEKKKQEGNAGASDEETIIDFMLEVELNDATKCKNCPKPQDTAGAPGARSAETPEDEHHDDHAPDDADNSDDDEDEDEDEVPEAEESDETEEVVEETVAEVTEVEGKAACKIVDDLFKNPEDFKEVACTQKYAKNNSRLGWKCVTPSGTTSGGSEPTGSSGATTGGSICVPPRRRKLYLGGFKRLTDDTAVSPQGDGEATLPTSASTSSRAQDPLLAAFVESAAVETFFLWDRYKKEWDHRNNKTQDGLLAGSPQALQSPVVDDDNNPQSKLQKSGTIPDGFLRQMFYTLGDYRDILFSGSNDVTSGNTACDKTNIVIEASGDKQDEMKKIQQKIKDIVEKLNGVTPTVPPTSVENPRKTWWKTNAQHIWNGMICALTYTDSGAKDQLPIVDQQVRAQLWDTDGNKPKNPQYDYKTVELKEDESGPRTTQPPASGENTPTLNNPKLTQFVLRPPYFRYLEEWGETFCRQRTRMLKDVRDNCTKDGTKQYSGFGEDCDDQLKDDPTTFKDLVTTCPKSCSSYRKWIGRKKDEYEEQKSAYEQQKTKCVNGNNKGGGNGFCETLQENAAKFLQKLASCKKHNGEGNGKVNNIFEDIGETFKDAEDCKPCSEFKIDCTKAKCTGDDTNVRCNGKKPITKDDIKYSSEEVTMLVSDNSGKGFKDVLPECENANIFKSIRKDQWKCRNVCGYVVCKSEKGNGETGSGENNDQIITIRALVTHWVQNFLDDYNKIKDRISHCMNNGDGTICISGCKNKCNCVDKWIDQKKGEWPKIRDRYIKQYSDKNMDGVYKVRAILEDLQSQIAVTINKAIKPCGNLNAFANSCGLNGADSSKKSKDGKDNDLVVCFLEKLQKKISECKDQLSDETQTQTACDAYTPPDDEDLLLEEEEENQVKAPKICPQQETPAETVEKGSCVPAKTAEEPVPQADGEVQTNQTPVKPPPLVPSTPAPAPADEPSKPIGDILSSTIPFGIAIALTSIVFLFLKVIHIVVLIKK